MAKDERPSYNAMFIPTVKGPIGSNPTPLYTPPTERDPAAEAAMPVTPKDTWKSVERAFKQGQNAAPAAPQSAGRPTMNSENYQKVYLQEQRKRSNQEYMPQQQEMEARAKADKILDKVIDYRNQATALRNEMTVWENMRGQGTDDQTINGQIQILQDKLNAIPPDYQY